MKLIWNTICIMALTNLLAVLGLVGWLAATDRLNIDRLTAIRLMLRETSTEQAAREAEEEAARIAAEEAAKPPDERIALSAAETLSVRLEMSEVDRERTELLRRQTEDLRAALQRENERLIEERAQFDARVKAFYEETERLAAIDGGRQFRKAVKVLEGLKASDAANLLQALIAEGPSGAPELAIGDGQAASPAPGVREEGMMRAVSYLNAMQERTRTRIIEVFTKQDPGLAAELLDRLRTRGLLDRPEEPIS